MKVVVSGAAGFLGRAIVERFLADGYHVVGLGRSAAPPAQLDHTAWQQMELPAAGLSAVLREVQPEVVIHAASSASVALSIEDPLYDLTQSVGVWSHMLEAIRHSGISCRTVLLSSAAVYGNPLRLPISEDDAPAPISPYGHHKYFCEMIANYYVRLYGLQICTARIFSAYGPGLKRQVVWDLCRKLQASPRVALSGTGEESRDFIHASDTAQAIACIVERGDFAGGLYNVASGTAITISLLAASVASAFSAEHRVSFNGQSRDGDPLVWRADIRRLSALGFRCAMEFEEGLRDYVDWARCELELQQ